MIAISGLALLVGAPRAAVEFGSAGLIAYAKLVATPVLGAVFIYVNFFPLHTNGRFAWLPSRRALSDAGWGLLITTCILLVAAALFGVGWLVGA
jgi:hypothetical protein